MRPEGRNLVPSVESSGRSFRDDARARHRERRRGMDVYDDRACHDRGGPRRDALMT